MRNPRTAILGKLYFEDVLVDEALVIPFAAPHSYTGEEAAEIHTHGNPVIVNKLLQILHKLGIEKADPGEFTKRAFLSGKLDLTQVEAIHEIIQAKSEWGVRKALQMKEGSFRAILLTFRSKLINLLADFSAELDFTEEGITFSEAHEKIHIIQELMNNAEKIMQESKRLQVFRDGIEVVIAGQPNTGKSSLLNFLSGFERSIVSEVPGTTRDYVQVELEISGIPITFFDTAGLREITEENEHAKIEKIGIERSIDIIKEASLVIWVLDGSKEVDDVKAYQVNKQEEKSLFLINKIDILHPSWVEKKIKASNKGETIQKNDLFISLRTQENTELVKEKLETLISQKTRDTSGTMLSAWQRDIFSKINFGLEETHNLMVTQEMKEIIVSSLQMVLDDLSQLTGEITNEDILGRIFSRFCIGK